MADECREMLTGNHFYYQKKSIFKFTLLMLEFHWGFTEVKKKKKDERPLD